jgi:CubicO group peptidase (beta-lactamase class C family)
MPRFGLNERGRSLRAMYAFQRTLYYSGRGTLPMGSQSVARSESIAAFGPALELLITEVMDEWKIPGRAVAVMQNGDVPLVKAYGLRDVEVGLKVTTDTQFLIGSVTKSFTSMGLVLLMDERRIDWKKPVRDYIPEFRLHDAVATDRVTVRDLLCHHSGLPRHDWIWVPGDLSPAQMLAAMRYLEPSDDIRSSFQTS